MKKFLIILLSLIMAFGLVGCVERTTPIDSGKDKEEEQGGNTDNTDNDEVPFTASLVFGDELYIPEQEVSVIWKAVDGSSISNPVPINSSGVAEVYGLDGDYTVTLSNIPEGFTYDPNIYVATNDNKDVQIELYELIPYTGTGTGKYSPQIIELTRLGAYRLTFTEEGQQIFCQYTPKESGVFSIESIVDISANEINPRLDVYVGTNAYKPDNPTQSINDGGASSIYTKNFKYEVNTTSAEISNTYAFAVKFESRIGVPVTIDFVIRRDGEFERDEASYDLVLPEENFYNESGTLKITPDYTGYKFVWFGLGDDPSGILDGKRVAYYSPEDGGDGYYHLLNDDGTISETILYAQITNNIQVGEDLSLQNDLVRLKFGGKDYTFLIRGYKGLVAAGYPNADDYKNKVSYIDCVNRDGVYAVTPELKDFLLAFCVQNALFFDGNGLAESSGYNSTDENQWLCFCGYYVK